MSTTIVKCTKLKWISVGEKQACKLHDTTENKRYVPFVEIIFTKFILIMLKLLAKCK